MRSVTHVFGAEFLYVGLTQSQYHKQAASQPFSTGHKMNQNPTIPPKPARPPPRPNRIPPVTEKVTATHHIVDPFRGFRAKPPIPEPSRPVQSSETDLEVVRHDEQIKGLERRLGGLEDTTESLDSKVDKLIHTIKDESLERKLEKATKDEEKVQEDQKTKRFQALLMAIPLILAPILGFFGSYMAKAPPDYKTNTVVVSEYTQEAAKCKETQKDEHNFIQCVREAQLKNTPTFEH